MTNNQKRMLVKLLKEYKQHLNQTQEQVEYYKVLAKQLPRIFRDMQRLLSSRLAPLKKYGNVKFETKMDKRSAIISYAGNGLVWMARKTTKLSLQSEKNQERLTSLTKGMTWGYSVKFHERQMNRFYLEMTVPVSDSKGLYWGKMSKFGNNLLDLTSALDRFEKASMAGINQFCNQITQLMP